MISLEKAVEMLLCEITPVSRTRLLSLEKTIGRIAAQDVMANIDTPPFDRSPLDGFALISDDIAGASFDHPAVLKVVAEIPAGSCWDGSLRRGQAAGIMTGGMIPKGADCVVRQEDTDEGRDEVKVYVALKESQNICLKGEDVRKGSLLLKKGQIISYAHLGVLAGVGQSRVLVRDKLRCAILSTGDELTLPGEPLERGKIYNSNLFMLAGRLEQFGMNVTSLSKVRDEVKEACDVIESEIDGVDVLLTTGGVSVGRRDIMRSVLERLGAGKLFWKVDFKPGTPVLAGMYRGKPLICLSGNPFAAMVDFELIARPALHKLSGDESLAQRRTTGIMADGFYKAGQKRRFVRAIYEDGLVRLSDHNHSSGALMSLIGCNALIDIEGGTGELKPGDEVRLVLL